MGLLRVIKPRPLRPGGCISICAPGGPVDEVRLRAAMERLKRGGFTVKTSPSAFGHVGLFSAPDDVRCRELEEAFVRSDVDAVFCARGGVGSSRLLSKVDAERMARSGKPFLGFSDVTALQWHWWARHHFVTFSGPLAVEWDGGVSETTQAQALAMLTGEASPDVLDGFPCAQIRVLRGNGRACGPLMPANLTMLTTLLGTVYLPELAGSILLIEDVNEPPYRWDRLLFHLRNAGVLRHLAALLIGDPGFTEPEHVALWEQSILDAVRGMDYPVVVYLPYSHGSERMTVPIGIEAELVVDPFRLMLKESPTTPRS